MAGRSRRWPGRSGCPRQTLHAWLGRYESRGLEGLGDRSHRGHWSGIEKPTKISGALESAHHSLVIKSHWCLSAPTHLGTAGGYTATLEPQSPDENDADKDGRDDGAFRAELLCNRHQLHSNGLHPTHPMPNKLGATGNRMRQQRASPFATPRVAFVIAGLARFSSSDRR